MKRNLSRLFSVSFLLMLPLMRAMDSNVSFDLKTAQVLAYDEPFLIGEHSVSLNKLMSGDIESEAIKNLFEHFLLCAPISQKFLSAGTVGEQHGDYTLLRESSIALLVVYRKMKQAWQYALLLGASKIFDTERLKDILVHNKDQGEQKDLKGSRETKSVHHSPSKSPFRKSPLNSSQEYKANKENRSTKSGTPSPPAQNVHTHSPRAEKSPRVERNRSEEEKYSPEGKSLPEHSSGEASDGDVATSAISDTGASSSSSTSSEKQAPAAQQAAEKIHCSTPKKIVHHRWQGPTPEILALTLTERPV